MINLFTTTGEDFRRVVGSLISGDALVIEAVNTRDIQYLPNGGTVTTEVVNGPLDEVETTSVINHDNANPTPALQTPMLFSSADREIGTTVTIYPPEMQRTLPIVSTSWTLEYAGLPPLENPTSYELLETEAVPLITYTTTDAVGTYSATFEGISTLMAEVAPTVEPDTATVQLGGSTSGNVLDNEDELNTYTISFVGWGTPSGPGTLTLNNDGSWSFVADPSTTGDTVVSYTIRNSTGGEASSTLTITTNNLVGPFIGTGQTEVENELELDTYVNEGSVVRLPTNSSGSVSGTFTGDAGLYNVTVRYIDDADGGATFSFWVNNVQVGNSWSNDGSAPSNTARSQVFEVALATGDVVEVRGVSTGVDFARIDWISIEAVPDATTQTTPRVFITSDLGGNDVDDAQSLIHALLYLPEVDLKGLGFTLMAEPGGSEYQTHLSSILTAYDSDLANLTAQSASFPTKAALEAISYAGAGVGETAWPGTLSAAASAIITEATAASASDPLYVLAWGPMHDIARALYEDATIVPKIRLITIAGQGQYEALTPAGFNWLVSEIQDEQSAYRGLWWIDMPETFRGMYVDASGTNNPDSAENVSFVNDNIAGRGALGALFDSTYRGGGTQATYDQGFKLGDTPSFTYLLGNLHGANLDDPTDPLNWGGEFTTWDGMGPSCWTDIPNTYDLGTYSGAETVRRHRTDYLADWATRTGWLVGDAGYPEFTETAQNFTGSQNVIANGSGDFASDSSEFMFYGVTNFDTSNNFIYLLSLNDNDTAGTGFGRHNTSQFRLVMYNPNDLSTQTTFIGNNDFVNGTKTGYLVRGTSDGAGGINISWSAIQAGGSWQRGTASIPSMPTVKFTYDRVYLALREGAANRWAKTVYRTGVAVSASALPEITPTMENALVDSSLNLIHPDAMHDQLGITPQWDSYEMANPAGTSGKFGPINNVAGFQTDIVSGTFSA